MIKLECPVWFIRATVGVLVVGYVTVILLAIWAIITMWRVD